MLALNMCIEKKTEDIQQEIKAGRNPKKLRPIELDCE
jgi:hypothetical protein